jgi:hypothetical protein
VILVSHINWDQNMIKTFCCQQDFRQIKYIYPRSMKLL